MPDLDQKTLETLLDERFEKQARMIKTGFDNTATRQDVEHIRDDIAKIDERLQIVEAKLDRALYTEYVHLEARVKRLEEKAGIKK